MENKIQQILDRAVDASVAPFLVAMTGNSSGTDWSGFAGNSAVGKSASQQTVFRIFSMTKAVGSLAAMILIDRDQLKLDTPVEAILSKFGKLKRLVGFAENAPLLRSVKTKATIRHLATHTSGLVYPTWDSLMATYFRQTKQPLPNLGMRATFELPLVFEPGDRWGYGIGIDWLGQVIEVVDGRRIDVFCQEEIFQPLGMVNTFFELPERLKPQLADVALRRSDGQFDTVEFNLASNPEFYGMGHALLSTAPDYLRFLRLFLNKGQLDGNRILSEAAVVTMLANHIAPLQVGRMDSASPKQSAHVDFFSGYKKSHSLGFLRLEEDVPGMRSAGSQSWAGLLNTHYWIDPKNDLAAVLMTQMLPFADPPFMQLYKQFERAVYIDLAQSKT